MTTVKRKPGRPRAYDPDRALASARDVFWDAGFASSSLDDLSAAMSMTRPSLYGAFGDKEALFLRTLEAYRDGSLVLLRERLDPERPLRECLAGVYATAIEIYLGGQGPALGCFLIGTATVEAPRHPEIRHILRDSLRVFDDAIEDSAEAGHPAQRIPPATDVSALAEARFGNHALACRPCPRRRTTRGARSDRGFGRGADLRRRRCRSEAMLTALYQLSISMTCALVGWRCYGEARRAAPLSHGERVGVRGLSA